MSVKKDFTIDVTRLLDKLRGQIEGIPSVMGLSWGVNKEDLLMQIGKIRGSLPRDVREAATVKRETDRIFESAQQEADITVDQAGRESKRVLEEADAEARRIIQKAELQQESMLAESEIMKLAKAQAQEIRRTAEREALEMRRGADAYAQDVLGNLETRVARVLEGVEKSRAGLENDIAGPTTDKPDLPKVEA